MNCLKQFLEEKNMTQVELATRLGVNKNTINNYCKRENFGSISANRLGDISRILGITYDELIYDVLEKGR